MTLKRTLTIAGLASTAFLTACTIPPEEGRRFLEERGYTNVTGGERPFFSGCGKGSTPGTFQAINPQGERVEMTLCKGLFGISRPLFGRDHRI